MYVPEKSQYFSTDLNRKLEHEAEKHLEEFCDEFKENPYLDDISIVSGVPHQEILKAADENDGVLIIQSSHGWSSIEQQLIGSQSEKVIRRSEKPVLTFKSGRSANSLRTVLLATDFSDTAQNALQAARYFSDIFRTKLHLLHVVNKQLWYDAFLLTGFEFHVLEEQVYKQAESCLRDLFRDTADEDIQCEIHIKRGAPLEQVKHMADKLHADLIVLGTHGNTNAESVLIGSVAEKIVRHSPCAVLTVPRQS